MAEDTTALRLRPFVASEDVVQGSTDSEVEDMYVVAAETTEQIVVAVLVGG